MSAKITQALENQVFSSGSTWIPLEFLKKKGFCMDEIVQAVKLRSLIYYCMDGVKYLTNYALHTAENEISIHTMRILAEQPKPVSEFYLNNTIKKAEKELGLSFHAQQSNGIKMAIRNNFCIITGGPGTGKTCVLNGIHFVLKSLNPYANIVYMAPTGKAASRITESTGNEASTLHKKLRITESNMNPTKVKADAIIVDEISMLDTFVAAALFKAVESGTKLILVGDVDQLPSVGPGAVLRDFIDSGVIPVTQLTKTFRQANDSNLFKNIQYLQHAYPYLEDGEDFHLYYKDPKKENVVEAMLAEYRKMTKKYGNDNVVCLMPYRKAGILCSNNMNKRIQAMVNPSAPYFKYKDGYFKLNDPVMQLVNREECANGDVGKIVKITSDGIVVRFFEKTVFYDEDDMEQIALAYAMSIHKSQGSEYKAVITCLFAEHETMLQRNLVYTAVTRAKQECSLFTQPEVIQKAIETDGSDLRFTLLPDKLVYQRKRLKIAYNI